jgi:probable HAF family extracellular repeat protein
MVGGSTTASGRDHAFLLDNGVMTDIGTLAGDYSRARGITNAGQIIGSSRAADDEHAVLWLFSGIEPCNVKDDITLCPSRLTRNASEYRRSSRATPLSKRR